jgi:hypothetical protein
MELIIGQIGDDLVSVKLGDSIIPISMFILQISWVSTSGSKKSQASPEIHLNFSDETWNFMETLYNHPVLDCSKYDKVKSVIYSYLQSKRVIYDDHDDDEKVFKPVRTLEGEDIEYTLSDYDVEPPPVIIRRDGTKETQVDFYHFIQMVGIENVPELKTHMLDHSFF